MKLNKDIIGMLHIPINTILAAPPEWRSQLNLPAVKGANDRQILSSFADWEASTPYEASSKTEEALNRIHTLSFYGYLQERMLHEAEIYTKNGISTFSLENVGAPYFLNPAPMQSAIFAIMLSLACDLRRNYPKTYIGLQILSYSDSLAMSAACYAGLDFIRSEGSLFAGERPEGRNANAGTLAKLYAQRDALSVLRKTKHVPRVYTDLQKKHTVFSEGLSSLDIWLDNIIFQKLEGVVITGTATGVPVVESDLAKARIAIDECKKKPYFPKKLDLPLIAGSGVDEKNCGFYKKYVDAVIAGSTLKEHGYWECKIDPKRVARFMEAWNK